VTLEATGSWIGNVVVECTVGNKSPVSLCSFDSNVTRSCMLDIKFEEKEDDVVFEVTGYNVHLTGFYLCHNGHSGK
ncbi:hypothetical protein MKW94_004186, partial [Papaver nudicaule]|nr:hypothetical protein [Papaver nudicaule]